MALSREEILHLAKLSKLTLSEDEITLYAKQLSTVVDYFKELGEVDTKNTEPTSQTTGLTDVLRQDTVDGVRVLTQEEVLSNAPDSHSGFFKVSAILKDSNE